MESKKTEKSSRSQKCEEKKNYWLDVTKFYAISTAKLLYRNKVLLLTLELEHRSPESKQRQSHFKSVYHVMIKEIYIYMGISVVCK